LLTSHDRVESTALLGRRPWRVSSDRPCSRKRFSVANIKSQIKRNEQNEKRRVRNRSTRSELRTRVKSAEAAAGGENEDETLRLALKRIDKAAAKGVIHKNSAARSKSRLIARIRAVSAETAAE
jgi:small subunit ribosomal protein S20